MSPSKRVEEFIINGTGSALEKYRTCNLSPEATSAIEVLESLATHIEENYGCLARGLFGWDKVYGPQKYEKDILKTTDYEEKFGLWILSNQWFMAQHFEIMECEYVLVDDSPINGVNIFKNFKTPTVAALTRSGYIKYVLLNYLFDLMKFDPITHKNLVVLNKRYCFIVPGTGRPVTLPEDLNNAADNFIALAEELEIPLVRLLNNMDNFSPTIPPGGHPLPIPPPSEANRAGFSKPLESKMSRLREILLAPPDSAPAPTASSTYAATAISTYEPSIASMRSPPPSVRGDIPPPPPSPLPIARGDDAEDSSIAAWLSTQNEYRNQYDRVATDPQYRELPKGPAVQTNRDVMGDYIRAAAVERNLREKNKPTGMNAYLRAKAAELRSRGNITARDSS